MDNGDEKECRPPQKKQRLSCQRYRPEYTVSYRCISPSPVSDSHVRCNICMSDFSISHGGLDDIKRHVKAQKHVAKEKAKVGTPGIANFLLKQNEDLEAMRAEVHFTNFLVEHNLPLSAADHAGKLFRKMFPNDRIAKDYACGRTKTTAIVKCLAREAVANAAAGMRSGPFVVGTDGSQEGGEKFFPMVIRYLKGASIATELVANPTCSESATGANIFSLLEETFSSLNVEWKSCLALACDNAHVMTGRRSGVIAFMRRKSPQIHLAGCICHLLHLAAKKATKAFQGEFDFDDFLRQVSWYFAKSSNRQQRLKALREQCGVSQLQLVDHCLQW